MKKHILVAFLMFCACAENQKKLEEETPLQDLPLVAYGESISNRNLSPKDSFSQTNSQAKKENLTGIPQIRDKSLKQKMPDTQQFKQEELKDSLCTCIFEQFHLVPAAEFDMGSNEHKTAFEYPAHRVYLDSFFVQKHLFKFKLFAEFVKSTGYKTSAEKKGYTYSTDKNSYGLKLQMDFRKNYQHKKANDEDFVVNVSFRDADSLSKWLSIRCKKRFMLPSEAQWEFAATHYSEFFPVIKDNFGYLQWGHNIGSITEITRDYFYEDFYKKSPKNNPIADKKNYDGSRSVRAAHKPSARYSYLDYETSDVCSFRLIYIP